MWNRQAELLPVRHEERRARAGGGGDRRDALIAIRRAPLENSDRALASGNVNAVGHGVVEQVVSVADDVHRNGYLARSPIEYQKLGWFAATYQDPVIRLVQRHRIVRLGR